MELLHKKITCAQTLQLIRRWLRAPVWQEGKLLKRRKGVPQGSPISPLLSNIMLHELDMEIEKRQLRFVRYADDFSIYRKTNKDARKTGNSIYVSEIIALPPLGQSLPIRSFILLSYTCFT